MLNSIIRQFLYQVEWNNLDFLVIDLPPGTGDAQISLSQSVPISGAIVVTTPQQVSLQDARRGLAMFKQLGVPLLGIVENMSVFIPPDMPGKKYEIFGVKYPLTPPQPPLLVPAGDRAALARALVRDQVHAVRRRRDAFPQVALA